MLVTVRFCWPPDIVISVASMQYFEQGLVFICFQIYLMLMSHIRGHFTDVNSIKVGTAHTMLLSDVTSRKNCFSLRKNAFPVSLHLVEIHFLRNTSLAACRKIRTAFNESLFCSL